MAKKFNDLFKIKKEGVGPVNHIAFILDVSGSMGIISNEALDNFNTQLRKIREKAIEQETYVTLVMFNGTVEIKFFKKDAREVRELERYPFSGSTALNDAIGKTIGMFSSDIPELDDESLDHSALLFVITDGYENASMEFNKDKIKKLIEMYEKKDNWTITFMGGDIDTQGTAVQGMSFAIGNTMDFSNTKEGYINVKATMTSGIDSYYTSRSMGMKKTSNFFSEEVKQQGELLKDKQVEGEMLKDEIEGKLLKPKKLEGELLWKDKDQLNENDYKEKKLNE